MFLFWFYASTLHCLISQYPYKEVRKLQENTVFLVEYSYVTLNGSSSDNLDAYTQKYNCTLTVQVGKDFNEAMKSSKEISKYSKTEKSGSFFFIAPKTATYLFTVKNIAKIPEAALSINMYEGRGNDPKIFSTADSHSSEIYKKVQETLEKCIKIREEIHNSDFVEEDKFRKCYNSMSKVIFCSVLCKIAATASTFFFFNKKIKEFYLSRKIIHE